jgi:hypothetical protein
MNANHPLSVSVDLASLRLSRPIRIDIHVFMGTRLLAVAGHLFQAKTIGRIYMTEEAGRYGGII